MAQFNNLMEILQLLDKSNCKKCNKPTCMAFAARGVSRELRAHGCKFLLENEYSSQRERLWQKLKEAEYDL